MKILCKSVLEKSSHSKQVAGDTYKITTILDMTTVQDHELHLPVRVHYGHLFFVPFIGLGVAFVFFMLFMIVMWVLSYTSGKSIEVLLVPFNTWMKGWAPISYNLLWIVMAVIVLGIAYRFSCRIIKKSIMEEAVRKKLDVPYSIGMRVVEEKDWDAFRASLE